MSQFKKYTFYKKGGEKMILYGFSVGNALDTAGYNLDYVVEHVQDYREGVDDSLKYVNGQWIEKNKPTISVDDSIYTYHNN